MARQIVGVDIGRDTIRAVELENPDKARPVIARYAEIALPPNAVSNGEVRELNTVAFAMRKLWSTGGFKSKRVVIGMGNQRVLARDLTVPKLGLQQIRESLPFQVQDMLPVPVSDALLDFYPLSDGVSEHGPVVHGLLIAAIKDSVLDNIKAISQAGLSTAQVDLIPFALTRVLTRGRVSAGTVALIDIGADTTSVVVASKGIPYFVRMMPSGGEDITSALVREVQVSPEQAEYIKRQRGILVSAGAGEIEQRATKIMHEVTQQLLGNIRNTLNFYSTGHPGDPIQSVVLSGRGSALPGLAHMFGDMMNLPVVASDPFADFDLSRSARRIQSVDRQSMTVALGLALGSAA